MELLKYPRSLKYKKLHRGSFKVISYTYNNGISFIKERMVVFMALGSGFYRWKTVVDFQKRIGRIFKKRKHLKFRFNISMNWSVSHKTHKSRMGKGKGVVTVED
jgi:hypothetical protein